jgi:hypothetical protein
MIYATTSVRDEQGFDAFVLRNESVELAAVPELGAKVVSLVNLRTGREWMASPERPLRLFRNRPADDFARSTLVGWDECLPTIAPCPWKGRSLPDHGEVWAAAWEVDHEAWRGGALATTVRLAVSPFRFQRTVKLVGWEVQIDYCLINTGDEDERFLWAMHALLTMEEGDRLELPPEVRDQLRGECWVPGLDFGGLTPPCRKAFARPRGETTAGVRNLRSGDALTFQWNTAENNTLGLWLTRGGWNGQHHLALEPANGMPDSLADAAARDCCGTLPARGTKTWSVRISIDP